MLGIVLQKVTVKFICSFSVFLFKANFSFSFIFVFCFDFFFVVLFCFCFFFDTGRWYKKCTYWNFSVAWKCVPPSTR